MAKNQELFPNLSKTKWYFEQIKKDKKSSSSQIFSSSVLNIYDFMHAKNLIKSKFKIEELNYFNSNQEALSDFFNELLPTNMFNHYLNLIIIFNLLIYTAKITPTKEEIENVVLKY